MTEMEKPKEKAAPRVTVLMGVYNGAEYLRQAVDSILCQTFGDFEFLIINDGSTDDSLAILNSYSDPRIRVVNNDSNIGLTRSLNKGLSYARAGLVARQDADDISHPTRLEKQVAFMGDHPDVVVIGTQAHFINSKGEKLRAYGWNKLETEVGIRWDLMFNSPFVHTSVMFRRGIVWNIEGGYDEQFITSQDFELWSRLVRNYKMRNLSEMLVELRIHENSVSANYTAEKIIRVRKLFCDNLLWNLPDYRAGEEWSDIWLGINNIHLHAVGANGRKIYRHLADIFSLFKDRYPEIERSENIKKHFAGLLLRAAFSKSNAHLGDALFLVRKAWLYSTVSVIVSIPRLVVNIARTNCLTRKSLKYLKIGR